MRLARAAGGPRWRRLLSRPSAGRWTLFIISCSPRCPLPLHLRVHVFKVKSRRLLLPCVYGLREAEGAAVKGLHVVPAHEHAPRALAVAAVGRAGFDLRLRFLVLRRVGRRWGRSEQIVWVGGSVLR